MFKQIFFSLLFNTLIVLGCNAMDVPVIHLEQTEKAVVKSVPNFLPLPKELNTQICEYVIDIYQLIPSQNLEDRRNNLKETLQTINSLALINKQTYRYINDNTDYLIKKISSSFGVSNAFIASMFVTKAANDRYIRQKKVLQVCLYSRPEALLQGLENLLKSSSIEIDWNFTYSFLRCLCTTPSRCQNDVCVKSSFTSQCEYQPHCKHWKICPNIALRTDSYTPLMIVCTQLSKIESIQFLISKGANVNSLTRCQKNVAMINVIHNAHMNKDPFVGIFLDQPIFDIHHQDEKKNTYLIWLCSLQKECLAPEIKVLLDKGPNPEIINNDGHSVLYYIDAHRHPTIFSLLTAAIEKKHAKK